MWTCGRSLQIALFGGLLITINPASAATSGQLGQTLPADDVAFGQSSAQVITVDPADLVFDNSGSGTLNFATGDTESGDETEILAQLTPNQVKRHVLEEAPAISVQPNRAGEFVVPIPAIGIGWTLLIGASMYRIGCKVLRVRN